MPTFGSTLSRLVTALLPVTLGLSQPAPGIRAGEAYPDFHLPRVDGGHGRLSDHLGRKILLFHFASW